MAIAALIFAFVFNIVGVILGHIALNKIKQTGENGRGLAIAALVIGYASIIVGIIVGVTVGQAVSNELQSGYPY